MKNLTTGPSAPDGRRTFICLVLAGCVVMAALFVTVGYEKTWHLWNIPTLMPYFSDARVITAGAESHALGYDPLVNSPRDPWGRHMNYPRIWQLLFYLHLDQSDTLYLGVIFAALFFAGNLLITKNIDRWAAWLMACAIFSPAVLLGIERANIDLVVFFVLACAVYVANKSRVATAGLIGFAFLLKLYPIFAVAVFLRERKNVFIAIIVASIVACGLYTVIMIDELKLVRQATPEPTRLAYGLDVVWMGVRGLTGNVKLATAVRFMSYAAVLVLAIVSLLELGRRAGPVKDESGHLDSFRAGAAVYIGSFLIGANWDYRLMFLLMVIPALTSWRRSLPGKPKRVAVATLICVVISVWSLFIRRMIAYFPAGALMGFLLDAVCKWIIFSGLLYLLFYSSPEWLKDYFPSARPNRRNGKDGQDVLPQASQSAVQHSGRENVMMRLLRPSLATAIISRTLS